MVLARRDREHVREMEAAVRAVRAEMEVKLRETQKEMGVKEEIDLKMRVVELEREKEDMAIHIGEILNAEGSSRMDAMTSAETLRRKQLERNYKELVRIKDERTHQFQREIKQL